MLYCNFSSTLKCCELHNTFNWKSTNCDILGCCFACWRVWRSAKQRNLLEDWGPPSRHFLLWIFSNSYWYERRRRWKSAVMSVRVWFLLGSITHASLLKLHFYTILRSMTHYELYLLLSKEKPTWCHLFYYIFNTHSMLNMFRPFIRPSLGVCD